MTTTTAAQDLTITRTATQGDAQLIVSMLQTPTAQHAFDGADLLFSFDEPISFEQFEKDFPHGSEGRRNINALLGFNETLGTFVKQGLLDRALVYDLYWISGIWKVCAPIAHGIRAKANDARMYENFEALAAGDR